MVKLQKHTPPPGWKNPLAPQQPLATTRFILAGFAATIGLAAVCVYITFCLLFWQGQWQLVFKPSRAVPSTPATVGVAYDKISFDTTETGQPQLSGWWIPAEQSAPFATDTVLLMHDGNGSLSDTLPQLEALHKLGINIFAFDYRGFGESANLHPSEASTYQDADAAWSYLTDTRHLKPTTIVLDGVGLGAAVAAETARRHPQAAALILENPRPPTLDSLQFDSRTRLLPIHLLFHDRFEIQKTLAHVSTPRLIVYTSKPASRYELPGSHETITIDNYADPAYADPAYADSVQSFLRKYLSGR
jgi:uncharacterized protein